MRQINRSHGLLLMTMILISMILSSGCSTSRPDVRLMPLARVGIPSPPKLKPILGLVPLKASERIVYKNGAKHFTVPATGGVFYPKKSAADQGENNELWRYYQEGVDDNVLAYNNVVDKHNERIAKLKAEAKKSWYEKLW
jgi:hypothetical protein